MTSNLYAEMLCGAFLCAFYAFCKDCSCLFTSSRRAFRFDGAVDTEAVDAMFASTLSQRSLHNVNRNNDIVMCVRTAQHGYVLVVAGKHCYLNNPPMLSTCNLELTY